MIKKEEELFDEWKKERPGFVSDGIVQLDNYVESEFKILYLLKKFVHFNNELISSNIFETVKGKFSGFHISFRPVHYIKKTNIKMIQMIFQIFSKIYHR